MERESRSTLKRGLWYSSLSGVIIALGLALYFSVASYSEWDAFGAALLAGGFFVIGPFVGLLVSALIAGLIYIPVFIASRRINGLPSILLPVTGSVIGLVVALLFSMRLENLILPVYVVFAIWGGLGGFLFVFGAGRQKSSGHAPQ